MELNDVDNYYEKNFLLKTVTIELLNHCNWNCKHCYLDKKKIMLPKYIIFDILDTMRKMGAYDIKLSGGEVTLRYDLAEIIQYARKKYLNVILLSNMYKLDRNVIDCIKEYGIGSIETTIFSLHEEIHDEFVGVKGALKATLNNIHMLKLMGINILVKTWAIKKNFHELEIMSQFCTKNGYNLNCPHILGQFKQIFRLAAASRDSFEYAH